MHRFATGIRWFGALAWVMLLSIPFASAQYLIGLGPGISEPELKAFARAYVELQQIRAQYEPAVQRIQDESLIKNMRQETNSRIEEALAKERLNVERYARIFTAVNSDETLQQKTIQLIEMERRGQKDFHRSARASQTPGKAITVVEAWEVRHSPAENDPAPKIEPVAFPR